MNRSVTSVWAAVRRYVESTWLLGDAERRAISYSDAEHALVHEKMRQADVRVSAARKLTSPAHAEAVESLYREAIALRMEAAAVGRDEREMTELRASLASSSAADTERRLRRASEPRSLATLRITRNGRIAGVAFLVASVLGLSIAANFAPPNIAFHRKVEVSHLVGAVPASELVDGVRETFKPVHVAGTPPSIDIDLGGIYALDSIRITNREDHHIDSSLPLLVLVAEHGDDWVEVTDRRIHFRSFSAACDRRRARFVRVTGGYPELALNEIEVFGRYAGP